jgi:hypothetical protein
MALHLSLSLWNPRQQFRRAFVQALWQASVDGDLGDDVAFRVSGWSIDELGACFVVRDDSGQALAYVYFEDESGRRSAAKLLSKR